MQGIDKLRINKSPGVDEVFSCVLKEWKNTISVALPDIFIKSIASGDVPSLRRHVNVIPTIKKGNKSVLSYYQPISVTSVIVKMLRVLFPRKYSDI